MAVIPEHKLRDGYGMTSFKDRPPLNALDTLRLKALWVLNVQEIGSRLRVAVADKASPNRENYEEALRTIQNLDEDDPESVCGWWL